MEKFFSSAMLLLVLLNPFFVAIYIFDLLKKKDAKTFAAVMTRAAAISAVVFSLFALLGDVIFRTVFQAQFASFQIFGGVIFLLIGIRFVFHGVESVEILRGESAHIAGAVAMPVLIGPGTLSASVLIGQRLPAAAAVACICFSLLVSVALMGLLKAALDWVQSRNEALVERYTEITGRIAALYVGTFAVEMIMTGLRSWLD